MAKKQRVVLGEHFTANVEVTKVTKIGFEPQYSGDPQDTVERQVEHHRTTVRANDIETLKRKVIAHVQLVDAEDLSTPEDQQ